MNKKFSILIIFGLFLQLIGSIFYFLSYFNSSINQILYFITKSFLILLPIPYFIFFHKKFKQGKIKILYKKSILIGLLSGIIFSLIIFITFKLLPQSIIINLSTSITNKVTQLGIIHYYIIFSIFLSFIHSFIEEYYWRLFIFNGLKTYFSTNFSYIISGVAFSLHHIIIVIQLSNIFFGLLVGLIITFIGIYWAYLYNKTNTIIGSWISHILTDLIIMYIGYTLLK